MKIFNDKYFNQPEANAFLNWRTDAPMFNSFYEVGTGFLSSSLITLQSIINDKNEGAEADNIIFPIMFNLWHGIELLLKSGIFLLDFICHTNNTSLIKTHKIKELYDVYVKELETLNLTEPQKDLAVLKELLDEFDYRKVNFDAFRYPYDSHWNEQFYNTTNNNIVENVCISLFSLQEKCLEILETLPEVIKYFNDTIISDGRSISEISDDGYKNYKKIESFSKDDYEEDEDSMKILLRYLRYTL